MPRVAQEIPKIGLVMEEVRIVNWLKNVGDTVVQGEPLVEVETEKSVVEIEAAVSGRLAEILLQVDQQASVGDQIAWIEADEAAVASSAAVAPSAPQSVPTTHAPAAFEASHSGDRVLSSPVARKLANEHDIDLSTIAGTGPRGRVQLDDVQRAIGAPSRAQASPALSGTALAPMRRALARAMQLSNATIPQFSVERAVDWTVLQAVRAEFNASLPADAAKLSVNDFLLQGVARALIELPDLNATFHGNPDAPDACIVPAKGAHIGLVLAVTNGLLVPVLHEIEQLGLAALALRRADCVERGLNGRLKSEELQGATFSISNLGTRGPDRFTALINPPQSAILAVGRQRDCVVARNGSIDVRPMSELSLSVDHRVADGRLASDFLARLVEILEGSDWRL